MFLDILAWTFVISTAVGVVAFLIWGIVSGIRNSDREILTLISAILFAVGFVWAMSYLGLITS